MKIQSIKLSDLFKQDEISYLDILIIFKISIKKNYKIILFIIFLMSLISVMQYKFTPYEYEASSTVLIEQNSNSSKNLSGISSLLGINMPMQQNESIGPDMYQEIIESQAFLFDLMYQKIPYNARGNDSTTLNIYFSNYEQVTFFDKLKNLISFNREGIKKYELTKNKSESTIVQNTIIPSEIIAIKIPPIVQINPKDAQIINLVKSRISVNFIGKKCIVRVKMPTPILSAIVSKLVVEKLTNYIELYKTTKQRDNIIYLQKRFDESELKYKQSQQKLANFKDNSLGLIFQSVQTREQVYTNELTINFNIYNQFAMQLEQAKIDLKKETPLFSVIEPITIPTSNFEPLFIKLFIKYLFVSFALSFLLIIYSIIKENNA
jgi:hypothetical protein